MYLLIFKVLVIFKKTTPSETQVGLFSEKVGHLQYLFDTHLQQSICYISLYYVLTEMGIIAFPSLALLIISSIATWVNLEADFAECMPPADVVNKQDDICIANFKIL